MLDHTETFGSLYQVLSELGAKNLLKTLKNISSNKEILQNDKLVSYAPKIKKLDTKLDFNHQAAALEARVRGLAPTPGAWFEYKNERFKVWKAEIVNQNSNAGKIIDDRLTIACKEQSIKILEIQREGKKVQKIGEFMLGSKIKKGSILSNV